MLNRLNAVIIIFIILLAGCQETKNQEDFATASFIIGDVKLNGRSMQIGDVLKEKDKIVTGAESSCDLRIGESMIRIKAGSVVMMSTLLKSGERETVSVGLDVGKMLCKPKKLLKHESFTVKTPTAVAGVRGTRFIVEADARKTTRIKVYDGKVKVVKRIPKLEENRVMEKVLEAAKPIEEKEKVVVTQKEVDKATKKVDLALESAQKKGAELDVAKVAVKVEDNVVVSKKDVVKFKPEEFKEERQEIIDVAPKSGEVVKKIRSMARHEKPYGSLLITRTELYFIHKGKVAMERKVVGPPLKQEDRIYIATKDYVFCASQEGHVKWRKKLDNDGRREIDDNRLIVTSKGVRKKLDLKTGKAVR